jgi:CelD/BcsL family acetyltransferase involved in cellulose biosynthesis
MAEGHHPVTTTFDSTAVIDLAGTWDGYLASRGTKWRNNYRRWTRRLAELGEVRHVRYRPEAGGDPRWDLYDECLNLAKASWQGSSQTGTTLTHENVYGFLRDSHQAAANCGALDLNLLTIDDRPVAFAYNYHFRGNVFSMRIGYLPELANVGVGNLLYTHALEDSFRRGDWNYDMGPAHMEAKRQLCTSMLPLYRLSCFRPISVRQQFMRVRRQIQARKQAATLAV